jgi:hypothetical protein
MRLMAFILALALQASMARAGESNGANAATASRADSDAYAVGSLAPSTGVPWNPPETMSPRRGWETTLNMPGRLITYPLTALGALTNAGLVKLEDSGRIPTSTPIPSTFGPSMGLSFRQPGLGGRAGVGAAAEYRREVLSGPYTTVLGARYAGTLRKYNGTLISATGKPLSLRYGYDWRPEELFYGLGQDSPEGLRTNYAVQSEYAGATAAWESRRRAIRGPRTRFSTWAQTQTDVMSHGRGSSSVSYEEEFPTIGDATLGRRVEHFIYGAGLSLDNRSGIPHWTQGSRLLLLAERHDAPIPWLALKDGTGHGAQYTRYQIEAETGFSWRRRDPRTLRFLGRISDETQGNGGDRRLVSELSTLGGSVGLAGFEPGRFHDLDAVLGKVSYLFPLARRLEMDVHSEWGAVYRNAWTDAQFTTLSNSFGATLRLRYETGPVAAIGIDASREGVRVKYALGGLE